jgi:2Fe-2S ferredoxin
MSIAEDKVTTLTRVRVLPHPDLCPQGADFEARQGRKLVDALLDHGIAIEHACEKVCACATCHVHLRAGGDVVKAADDLEEDQLGAAWGLDAQSRLACCVRLSGADVVVELPLHTRNHARER